MSKLLISAAAAALGWCCFAPLSGSGAAVAARNTELSEAPFTGDWAGAERTVGGVRFCWCPAGSFRMGSPVGEPGRRADEAQVDVVLTQGFWTGKYEVTQGQWRRVVGALRRDPDAGNGENFPVYWTSYLEAEEFCRQLTQLGRAAGELPPEWEVRLPTEAQWEYACRAGTTTAFAGGETLTKEQANIGRPFRGAPPGYPDGAAVAVGSYPANPWGLHDMHGNVFEWCRDWYHGQSPGGRDPDLSAQRGAPNRDGSYSRVRRGGAWMDDAGFCRSALRLRYEPERSSDHIGFRVVIVRR